jgi:hypothetical protein
MVIRNKSRRCCGSHGGMINGQNKKQHKQNILNLFSKYNTKGVKNKINNPKIPSVPCSASMRVISSWDKTLTPVSSSLISAPLPPTPKMGLLERIYLVLSNIFPSCKLTLFSPSCSIWLAYRLSISPPVCKKYRSK